MRYFEKTAGIMEGITESFRTALLPRKSVLKSGLSSSIFPGILGGGIGATVGGSISQNAGGSAIPGMLIGGTIGAAGLGALGNAEGRAWARIVNSEINAERAKILLGLLGAGAAGSGAAILSNRISYNPKGK